MSSWADDNYCPKLWRIKTVDNNRQKVAQNKSVLWFEQMIKWHVRNDQNELEQLLQNFMVKNKSVVWKVFDLKHWQLNAEQAHEYQQIVGLLNWQMDATQRYFRKTKNILLFPNKSYRHEYRKQFWITSAQVHMVPLQLTNTCVKRQKLPIQDCKVYHVNEIESLGQLCTSIFTNGRFYIQQPLSKHEWLYTSGWDRSVKGLAQSGCLGITKHYHGKYGSIIQTLTGENVAENADNYRELNNQWYKRELTNQMLKFPCMIVMAVIKRNADGTIVSKAVETCVMSLNLAGQKQVDIDNTNILANTPSPPIENLRITRADITNAINAGNNASQTQLYWQKRAEMINLDAYLAVSIPDGLNTNNDTSNLNFTMSEANTTSMDLLSKAKTVKYRFKKTSKKAHNESKSNDNINEDNDDNTSVVTNLSQSQERICYSTASQSDENCNTNDNHNDTFEYKNDRYDSNNDAFVQSASDDISDFNINDESPYDTDGNRIIDEDESSHSNYSSDDSNEDNLHRLHPLSRWNFNNGSRLNRMAESDWLWKRKHCKASACQGNRLYLLDFESLSTHEWNIELPMFGTYEIADTLTAESLFDHINGIKHLYLPCEWIPNFDENNLPCNRLYGITLQDMLIGLLQVYVTDEKHAAADRNGNTNGRKCYIFQRCATTESLDVSKVQWNESANIKFADINTNVNILDEIGSNSVKYDGINDHEFMWSRVELKPYLQFDNSAKNMVAGISKATSRNPCATCEVSGDIIYDFPHPDTWSFRSRQQLQTVERSLHLNKNETHNQGCKESPIWDCPIHRYGPSTLHNFEGIFALNLACLKDYIYSISGDDHHLNELQQDILSCHKMYAEIVKLQNAKTFLTEQTSTPQIQKEIDDIDTKLIPMIDEYDDAEQKCSNNLDTANRGPLRQYLQILKQYKINEYYCMAGSVQGIMCKRICLAREALIKLVKSVNGVYGILWELLLQNLNFVYQMLKPKHHVKWTAFDLATLKHAYIDMYHQMVLVVRSWKDKGDLTIKPHYLCHDLEYSLAECMSTAFVDEERIENCNAHVKGTDRLYNSGAGNQYGCREMLVGRRMNNRVLSCG